MRRKTRLTGVLKAKRDEDEGGTEITWHFLPRNERLSP